MSESKIEIENVEGIQKLAKKLMLEIMESELNEAEELSCAGAILIGLAKLDGWSKQAALKALGAEWDEVHISDDITRGKGKVEVRS